MADLMKNRLMNVARDYYKKGPGFAQTRPVLSRVADDLQVGGDLAKQQRILTAWHDLFREGRLSWGYDFDNPSAPFFHVPEPPSKDKDEKGEQKKRQEKS